MIVGISFGSMMARASSSTFVDSAEQGSQEDASLFWTSVSFWAKWLPTMKARIQNATRTIHLVTRPVSLPAI